MLAETDTVNKELDYFSPITSNTFLFALRAKQSLQEIIWCKMLSMALTTSRLLSTKVEN